MLSSSLPGLWCRCTFLFLQKLSINQNTDGLILSCGHKCSHVIPVLNGQADFISSQRLNVGGFQMLSFLHRLLQLKYPAHIPSIVLNKTEEYIHSNCYCSEDYAEELQKWELTKYHSNNVRKIQLPYTQSSASLSKTFNKMERCKEMVAQLRTVHFKRRMIKLSYDEERLNQLKMIEEMFVESDNDIFQRALHEFGYTTLKDLQDGIAKLKKHLQYTKNILNFGKTYSHFDDLELSRFSDADSWVEAVRKKWKTLQDLSLSKLNREMGFEKNENTEPNNLPTDTEEYDELAEQERIVELEDVIREYQAQFNKEDPVSVAEYYQLHLGIERIRIPEVVFQPSMLGLDQAGLSETVENVLQSYLPSIQLSLVQNVLLTGGCFSLPGMKSRIVHDLRQILPFQSPFNVNQAGSAHLDAWNGARLWAIQPTSPEIFTSRSDYEEHGPDYFKEHFASNPFLLKSVN